MSILILLVSCLSEQIHSLESLLKSKLTPPTNTHGVKLYAKGAFLCPYELWILIQDSKYQKIILHGSVDTIIYNGDWYGEDLSFKSETPECMDKEAVIKVTWRTL